MSLCAVVPTKPRICLKVSGSPQDGYSLSLNCLTEVDTREYKENFIWGFENNGKTVEKDGFGKKLSFNVETMTPGTKYKCKVSATPTTDLIAPRSANDGRSYSAFSKSFDPQGWSSERS